MTNKTCSTCKWFEEVSECEGSCSNPTLIYVNPYNRRKILTAFSYLIMKKTFGCIHHEQKYELFNEPGDKGPEGGW
jgi:hypothetical protein